MARVCLQFYVVRGLVSVGAVGAAAPTDFWNCYFCNHFFTENNQYSHCITKEDIKYDFVKFWIIGLQKLLLKSLIIDNIMEILITYTSDISAVAACLLSKWTVCSSNPAMEGFYLNWEQSRSRFWIHIFKISRSLIWYLLYVV